MFYEKFNPEYERLKSEIAKVRNKHSGSFKSCKYCRYQNINMLVQIACPNMSNEKKNV